MDASIIIPAHNSQATIGKTIQSILDQKTTHTHEIIVIDDGSSDETLTEVKKFPSVHLFAQKHGGPAKARNRGAKKAIGDCLLFLDADCVADPQWLNQMLAPFKHPNVAGVQGAYRTRQKELMARFTQIEIEDRYDLLRREPQVDWIGSYSAAYLKRAFRQVNGFDESFPTASGEDPELSFKVSRLGYRLEFNPQAIVYHQHPKTLLHYLSVKFFRAYYRVRLYKKHPRKAVKDSYTPQMLKIRILLIAITFGSTALLFIHPFFSWLLLVSSGLIALSVIPFTVKAFRKDPAAGIIAPFILLLRDTVFLFGLLAGSTRVIR